LAFTMQKEQRSNFEGQVTLHQAQLKQRQYNELKLELEKHETELSQAEVGQQIYSTQEPVQLIAECTSDGVIEDLENAPTDSEPLASADRVFESTSDAANNPIAMMSLLAADTTLEFTPQDGIFPKPYSRPECEAAFQAQHTKKRIVVIMIASLYVGITDVYLGSLEISRWGPWAQTALMQIAFGFLFLLAAVPLCIERSKWQFRHFEICCMGLAVWLLFVIQTIVITSAKYHTPVEFSKLSEATILGWTTGSISLMCSYMLGYVAAPSYMFILPLAHLVPMNTSPYLASPGLTAYSVLSFVQTVWIAKQDQMEQRNTFERQVQEMAIKRRLNLVECKAG